MTYRKFLESLVHCALDRIESSLPPTVTCEEALDGIAYRHGVAETVAATFQDLVGTEEYWAMTDLMAVSGFNEVVEDFLNARLRDANAPIPEAGPIVDRLLEKVGEYYD